jgi:hypothetical protein
MTEPITVDNAIHDWIVAALPTVAAAQAIWADQNTPQPTYPYVTLKRPGFAGAETFDETRTTYDGTADAGEEIELEEIELLTTGPREFTLTVTAHVDDTAGAYDDANASATALLSAAQSSLGKRSVLDALSVAGIAIIERLPVLDTSAVVNGEWNSQAAMEIRMRVTSNVTEQTGYIAKLLLSSTLANAHASLDLDDYLIDDGS